MVSQSQCICHELTGKIKAVASKMPHFSSIVIKPSRGVDPAKRPGPEFHGSTQKNLKKYI
jgi:hypothetical protein